MTDDVKKLGEPITLEQLRGMDGEPVWSDDGDWSTWGIVSVQKITPDKDKVFFCGVKHGIRFMFDVEKEGFKLHRYLPVKLDDWEPCEYCNGERTPYQHTHSTKLFIDTFGSTRTLLPECSGCPP